MSYKVKKGDSLSKIAKQHGLTLDELMRLNNISKENADKIAIGQELKTQSSYVDFKNPLKLDYLQSKPAEQELPTPYRSAYTKKQQIKDNAKSIQQQLKDAGYDLGATGKNKDGVDGSWGRKSQVALDQALKDGYVYDEKSASIYKKEKPKLKERSSTASYQYSVNPMFGTPLSTPYKNENKAENKIVNNGKAIYLHYPNFKGKASNALKIMGFDVGKAILGNNSLPVGHGETLLVDENGKVKYVRYGRYTTGTGEVRPNVKGGNWGIYDYPDMKPNETTEQYVNRLLDLNKKGGNYLEDSKYGAFEAIEIPNVNYQKALDYAVTQSKDSNRPEYSITNTCATGACNTIKAGLSEKDKMKTLIPTFSGSDAEEVTGSTVWGWIPGSTNKYAQDMRDLGKSYIFNKNNK